MATLRRNFPPARFVIEPAPQGQTNRIRGGGGQLFDASKKYGGGGGGKVNPAFPNFLYRWIDIIQVNPASEQPRLIYNSGAQPIIRWGYRRFVRTFMAASPRNMGRWFYAGTTVNQFVARGRMTGVTTMRRPANTYPRFQTGPRTIQLGAK
jgi:hypothetical protein